MDNIIITLRYNVNLDRGVVRQRLPIEFGTGDKEAHKIILTACRATGVVDLTGAGVMAYVNRSDGTSVIVDGSIEDGKAVVILPEACYAVNGAVSIAVKLTRDESRTMALWLDGHINRTSNETLVDPGNVVPSLESLLAEIDTMRTATDEAETVTENAQAVVDSYNGTVASQNSSITDLRKRTGDLESAIGIRASSGKNLLNPADIVEGQWSTGGTTLTPGAEYISYAHRIPVKGGTTYTISNDGVAEGMKVATLTEFAADGSRPGISQYWADTTFTTAATTVELLISLEATWDKPQLEEGSTATAYEPYGDHVTSRMQDEIDALEKVVEWKADKPLLGGKICAYGDSLAASDNGDRNVKTWIDYAAEQLGCARAYNRGVGSTTVTDATKDGTPRTGYVYVDAEGDAGEVRGMYTTPRTFAGYPNEIAPWMCTEQRIATIPEDTDAVVIIAGTNDVGTTTVDGFAEAYGQMLTLMAQLRPNMQIYTCTMPFQQTYDMGTAAERNVYNSYRLAIKRVSEQHGIPCINLKRMMGVNADNYTDYMNDATHYNTAAGRRLIARCVCDALMTISGYAGEAGLAFYAREAEHAADADTVRGVDVVAQIAKNAEDTAAVRESVGQLSEEIAELKDGGSTGAWGTENANRIIATDGSGNQVAAEVDEAFEVSTVVNAGIPPEINLFDESTMIKTTSWYVNMAGKVLWEQNQYTSNYTAVAIPLYNASKVTLAAYLGSTKPRIYQWFIADEENNILSESAAGVNAYLRPENPVKLTIPAGASTLYISGRFNWAGVQVMVNTGAESKPYAPYVGVSDDPTAITYFKRKNDVEVSLPERYELVAGDTFELFWKGVVKALNHELCYIEAVCAKGAPYQSRYIFAPVAADVGEHTLTVNVYDQMHILLASGSTKLVVKAKTTSPTTEKVVLYVGDSLANGGQVPDELHRRLTASDGAPVGDGLSNIAFIGTCSSARNSVPYEGYGGWTFENYNTENKSASYMWITASGHGKTDDDQHSVYKDTNGTEWKIETVETGRIKIVRVSGSGALPTTGSLAWVSGGVNTEVITYTASEQAAGNPFWDDAAGKVDFASYAAEQGKTNIDYVYVLLGWNDMTKSDADITSAATTFIGNVHASFPTCKVVLLGLQIPARDGLAANYGASETWTYYNAMSHVMRLNRLYEQIAKETENVSFVQVSGQFDTDHNMPTRERTVNVRNSTKETYQSNGVHPMTSGYYQIADACYRDFVHKLQS